MESSLLTLLIAVVIVTFALGFIFARLAKLARLSSSAPQFATEGASANMQAVPEPADVLTQTQFHYQQTHINGLNTQVRMLEEKLRWVEQDRREAEDAIIELQQQLKAAQGPRGDEVTQREAEIALLRAQLNAAISHASKLERKLIRAESDAQSAQQENQELRAKIWAQQSTDMALNRLQDRQAALQAAIIENQKTRDELAGEVVALNASLVARESLLAEREATLESAERRLNELDEDYARLAARENEWEKQCAVLADMQAAAAQAQAERDAAQEQIVLLHMQLNNAGGQVLAVQERLHAMHEAMALRDGQVTELHGELRRLQLEIAFKQDAIEQAKAALNDLRNDLAHTVNVAEETRTVLRLRESAVTSLQGELAQAKAQRDTLEAALVLATSNLETLREQFNDAEAGRMLLEAELQNKTEALAIANEDLGQLSSREYELTVALERSGREHQSSLETALIHMNRLEEDLKQTQAAFATKEDEAGELAEHLQQAKAQAQTAQQNALQRDAQIASLQMQLQDATDALENRNAILLAAQREAGEMAEEVKTLTMMRFTLETHLHAKAAVLATAEAMIASMKTSIAEREQQLADLRILANERGRELESAHAQITYLISGMDDLNNTANEKYAALIQAQHACNEAQTALEIAESRIGQLIAEQDLLKSELAGVHQHNETLAGENNSLHSELASVLKNASAIQSQLDESLAQIDRMQFEAMAVLAANQLEQDGLHQALVDRDEKLASLESALASLQSSMDELIATKADALRIIGAQAGEIAALAIARSDAENAFMLTEARIEELAQALKAAGDQQATLKSQFAARSDELETLLKASRDGLTDAQSELEWLRIAHNTLQLEHKSLKAAKAAADEILEAQAGEINALGSLRRQNESALVQAESQVSQLTTDLEKAVAGHAVIEAMLKDSTAQQAHLQLQLDQLRQAHAALLMEHDALQKMRAALELQTRNQMETLVEMSNAAAAMQKDIQEREAALQAAEISLAEAQQVISRKPDPATFEARLTDTTLTLQRLEKDYAALQAEKDAIEDEFTREQMAGHLRVQEKEAALHECGAQVDALELEIALLKTQQSK